MKHILLLLDIVSTIAFILYALVCGVHAGKFLADPLFTDTVLGPRFTRSTLNPRLFLYELEHLAVPLLGDVSLTILREVGGCFLLCGFVGGLVVPWVDTSSGASYFCILLLFLSLFYFLTVIPYLVHTAQIDLMIQPCLMLLVGGLATAYKVVMDWTPPETPEYRLPYTSSLYLIGVLLLFSEAAIICWMNSNSDKIAASSDRFHLIRDHFMENNMQWEEGAQFPSGYSESRLLLSV